MVKYDREFQRRFTDGTLTLADHALLALATHADALFPEANACIGPMRQSLELPAVFVRFYSMHCAARLENLVEYEFGFELQYWAKERSSDAELNHALFLLLQNLQTIPSDTGEFRCYGINGEIVDRIAQVTGIVKVHEQTLPDDPIIQTAEKELKTK